MPGRRRGPRNDSPPNSGINWPCPDSLVPGLYFEQDKAGNFVLPEDFPMLAFATLGTHDLATLDGWWRGSDIQIRETNHLYSETRRGTASTRTTRWKKRRLLAALYRAGLNPGDGSDALKLAVAVHTFVARSQAAVMMMKLDDLTGEDQQVNVPATTDQVSELEASNLGAIGAPPQRSTRAKNYRQRQAGTPLKECFCHRSAHLSVLCFE